MDWGVKLEDIDQGVKVEEVKGLNWKPGPKRGVKHRVCCRRAGSGLWSQWKEGTAEGWTPREEERGPAWSARGWWMDSDSATATLWSVLLWTYGSASSLAHLQSSGETRQEKFVRRNAKIPTATYTAVCTSACHRSTWPYT